MSTPLSLTTVVPRQVRSARYADQPAPGATAIGQVFTDGEAPSRYSLMRDNPTES